MSDLPKVEIITPAPGKEQEAFEGMLHGLSIRTFQAVEFKDNGTQVLYDYNIPAAYNNYTAEKRPSSSTGKNEPWVRYGSDNKYPHFILKLAKSSATQKRAYTTAAGMGKGKGLVVDNDPTGKVTTWLRSIGADSNFWINIFQSQALYAGYYTRFAFRGKIEGRKFGTPLAKVDILPWHNTRPGKANHVEGKGHIWLSADFNKKAQADGTVYGYPELPKDITEVSLQATLKNMSGKVPDLPEEDRVGVYAHYQKSCGVASDIFPDPHWESSTAINAILMEVAISTFDLSSMENGLTAAYMVSIPFAENPADKEGDEERKARILEKVRVETVGANNAGKVITMWVDPRIQGEAIKILPIPSSNKADLQKILQERKDRLMATAWGVPDERLIGILPLQGKGLSSQADALRQAEDVWYGSVVNPYVTTPVEEWANDILLPFCPDFVEGMRITFPRVNMVPRAPSDEVLVKVFTPDEIREMYGYPPLTDEQKVELIKDRIMEPQSTGNGNA